MYRYELILSNIVIVMLNKQCFLYFFIYSIERLNFIYAIVLLCLLLLCLLAENGAMRVRADERMHNKTLPTKRVHLLNKEYPLVLSEASVK